MRPHKHAQRQTEDRVGRCAQRRMGHRQRRLIVAIGLLILLGMALGGPATSRAEEGILPIAHPGANPIQAGNEVEIVGQSYFDGLTVAAGQTLAGDVVVWSGDATVESGGLIGGGLVVYQGDVHIREGGEVSGDVTAWAGQVEVDGYVGGSVSAVSGDVELGDNAFVAGDVSTLSGEIDREESAQIGGNIVRGPRMNMPQGLFGQDGIAGFGGSAPTAPNAPAAPEAPAAPDAPAAPELRIETGRSSFAERALGLVFRMIGAAFATVFVTLAAAVVYAMRPALVQRTQDGVRANPTRAFALGISVNLALWLAFFIFSRAWCLAVLALAPMVLLLFVNAVGFAAVARLLGQRLGGSLQVVDRRPILEVVIGALLIAAVFNFLPALFGGGSGVFFGLVALFVTAPGVGAFVQPWIEGYRSRRGQNLSSPGRPVPPVPPVPPAPAPPVPPVAPVSPAPVSPAPVTPDAQRREDAALAPVEPSSVERSESSIGEEGTVLEVESASPASTAPPASTASPASTAPYVFALPEEVPAPPLDPGLSLGEVVHAADAERAAAEEAARHAREQAIAAAAGEVAGDDFTRITGVGRSGDRKLKAAGIARYAQLAALPVEVVASILGITVEEVIEDELLKQAAALSA